MVLLNQRVKAFDKLSSFLIKIEKNKTEYADFFELIKKSYHKNKSLDYIPPNIEQLI